jgi:hypothetical protein
MTQRIHKRGTRFVITAVALAAPSVVLGAIPAPADAKPRAAEARPARTTASRHDQATPANGALLRGVLDSLAEVQGQEASPFEPPGQPPDRPPGSPPGQNDPPNPPGKPSDRPPGHRGHGGGSEPL